MAASWHSLDKKKVFEAVSSSETGLSGSEAGRRLAENGPNELVEKKRVTVLEILVQQFKDFLILMLIAAALISLGVGLFENTLQEIIEAGLILIIVLFIVVVGFYQEYNAERELEALKRLITPFAVVERDGEKKKIPASQVVVGDIIHIEAGDRVPADARIIEALQFKTDESMLTGESQSVKKTVEPIPGEHSLGDRLNMVYMGVTVTYGKASAVVVATGMETEFGRIAGRMQEIRDEKTPLQERLDVLGKQIGVGVVALCGFVFAAGVLTSDIPWLEMFLTAIALAVAAVPEGLPGVVTVTLAMGTRRMVSRNVIVRKLPAVETLGSTTVICTDKTGTLTHNEMTVKKIFVDGRLVDVEGDGYRPQGGFLRDGSKLNPKEERTLVKLLSAVTHCNDASLSFDGVDVETTGDPTELSLLVAAAKAGVAIKEIGEKAPRVGEVPFDSERKRMSTINGAGKSYTVYSKGAPDVLLELCTSKSAHGKVSGITVDDRKGILEVNDALAKEAFRVLAVAYKDSSIKPTPEDAEDGLVFLGLVAMKDPPREDAREAIEKCRNAGIKVIMITGDHTLTAVAVALEIGLDVPEDKVMTGRELSKITDEELDASVDETGIYARVNPEHKLRIITALQKKGHVVAMTGDGVNDAPALKKADIGVAMGITGTDVSKEASDMVLTDDNFASIVAAVEEGRGIYDNIKKFFAFLISGNIGEVAIVFITSVWSAVPIALTATQILLINLVTDGLPALALGVDPFEPNAMKYPPRNRKEPLYRGLKPFIVYYPLLMIAITLGIFYWVYDSALGNTAEAQTAAFLTVAFFEMYQAFAARSTRYPSTKIGLFKNKWLILAVASSLFICLALVYVPLNVPGLGLNVQEIMHLQPISVSLFLTIIALSSIGFIYLELAKHFSSRKALA
ncbi:MAG: cation-translocating P-type ATPase [Candidatus Altiarchaeota archaeon]